MLAKYFAMEMGVEYILHQLFSLQADSSLLSPIVSPLFSFSVVNLCFGLLYHLISFVKSGFLPGYFGFLNFLFAYLSLFLKLFFIPPTLFTSFLSI